MDALLGAPPAVGAFALAFAMLGGLWTLLATGRMVPGSVHRDRVSDKNEQIADLKAAVQIKDDQLDKALVGMEAWHKTMDAIEEIARQRTGDA